MVQAKLSNKMQKIPELLVARKRGASVIDHRPVFSYDCSTLFVASGTTIRSYNVETGHPILDYEGLNSFAAGVALHPSNNDILVALSCEGQLVEWEWRSNSNPSRTILLKLPGVACKILTFYVIPPANIDEYSIVAAVQNPKQALYFSATVVLFSATTGESDASFHCFNVSDHSHSLIARHHEKKSLIVGIIKHKLAYIIMENGEIKEKGFKDRPVKTSFTSVTCHPSEQSVLVGCTNGHVYYWENLLSSKPPTRYQWHNMPVRDIMFDITGNTFYSGGDETVVVRWMLHSPNKRSYIPRFPAEIVHLSASSTMLFCVSTRDNAIEICATDSFKRCVIQHFSWMTGGRDGVYLPAGLNYDPRSNSLVLNAQVGHIQFLKLPDMTSLSMLDVTERNYLTTSRKNLGGKLKNTEVMIVEFNSSGQWLATVEHWPGEHNVQPDWRLKFWEYSNEQARLVLNTCVEYPHQGAVNTVKFRPTVSPNNELCITCGEDKKFRTWVLTEKPGFQELETMWSSENVGFHHDLPAGPLDFSTDGSLVAIAFGPTLTIWVPKVNELKCSLTQPHAKPATISHVQFGRETCSHLVTIGSKQGVAVWNILSLSISLVVPFPLHILVADPLSSVMAAFTERNDVVIFSPNSPDIIHKQVSLLPEGDRITAAAFIPHCEPQAEPSVSWQSRSQLYFVNTQEELLCLVPVAGQRKGTLDSLPKDALVPQPSTLVGALRAQQTHSDVVDVHRDRHSRLGIPGFQTLREILVSPAHTMPSLSLLCRPLLSSFITSGIPQIEAPQKKSLPIRDKMEEDDSGAESIDEERSPPENLKQKTTPK